jgi:hypothetical protein
MAGRIVVPASRSKNPIPGVRVPFYQGRLLGLALDVSLVSSASVDPGGSAPRPRPDALKHQHAEKMRKHGIWCPRHSQTT